VERIKQALERARAEREAGVGARPPAPTPPFPPEARPVRERRAPLSDGRVAYTQTRTLELDQARLRELRVVAMVENDPAAIAYKVLRTHIVQRMRANGWQTLAVTSPSEGNGKTVTAINLAISLAADANQTVLLVDLDLRRPSIGRFFSAEPLPGLSDYLTEERPVAELLFNPAIERLVVLPGNHSFTHSSEALSSPRMASLIEELKGRYSDRLILFDMPPVLSGDDVIAFSSHLDAVMLVVEEGRTTQDELSRAYELLGDEKVLGTVLNKAEEASTLTGYY